MTITKEALFEKINEKIRKKGKSRRVLALKDYADDLVETIIEINNDLNSIKVKDALKNEKTLLSFFTGEDCKNFYDYSYKGYSLCYDYQICERICTPSEQKRYNYGSRMFSKNQDWLEVQAIYLEISAEIVIDCYKELTNN